MAAAAPGKGKRKRDLSEDDVYLLLHRYTPTAILTALQEVAQHAQGRNIDWRALVAKTATGITSPREYQMLWRYFAYRHDLAENVDASAQPLGDESDLECEVEPVPAPSKEAVAEASGFAKILLSGSSREQACTHRVNAEAPVLNAPNEKIPRVSSDKQLSHRLTNGTGPVSNSKQAPLTGLSLDPFDGNGAHKKKKKPKPWSKEEDADLTAGVCKFGEGNWLNILQQFNFDSTRTHAQLSQRWTLISKRQGIPKPACGKPASVNLDIKAAQMAFSMALDMPMRKAVVSTSRSGASQSSVQHTSLVFGSTTPEVKSVTASSSLPVPVPAQVQLPLPQVQQAPTQAAPLKVSNTSNKSRNKKQAAQPNPTNAPSSIQAAAIAAGGRIATPSVATNLLKAAQSKKAVHIRFGGIGSSKTSKSSSTPTMAAEPEMQVGSAQHQEPSSAHTPSPLVTYATEQVHIVSEVNPSEQFAGAHCLEANRTLSTTAEVSGPCVNIDMDDDSTFCSITIEDLFPEGVNLPDVVDPKCEEIIDPKCEEIIDPKDADMLEFDRFVARGCLNMDSSDQNKTVKNAPEDQGASGSQKEQSKPLSAAGRSIPVFSRATVTGKKTKNPAPHGTISPPTVASSGLVGTGNAGVLSKALSGKPAAPGTTARQKITGQKQQPTNSKTPAKNAALGTGTSNKNVTTSTGTPAKNTALSSGAPARSVIPSTGTPANRQGNQAVNAASKTNPPSSQ